jgi:hypothetical protein
MFLAIMTHIDGNINTSNTTPVTAQGVLHIISITPTSAVNHANSPWILFSHMDREASAAIIIPKPKTQIAIGPPQITDVPNHRAIVVGAVKSQ